MDGTLTARRANKGGFGVHPKMFALWLAIGAIVMMFASLTSAFIVKRADSMNWLNFSMPSAFYLSSLWIVLSSATAIMAHRYFKKQNESRYAWFLGITAFLGLLFMFTQYIGWRQLTESGLILNTHPSTSFLYVISGMHIVHVLGGWIALLFGLVKSIKLIQDPIRELHPVIDPERSMRVKMMMIYWHFVDGLWIYLFVFFLINYNS